MTTYAFCSVYGYSIARHLQLLILFLTSDSLEPSENYLQMKSRPSFQTIPSKSPHNPRSCLFNLDDYFSGHVVSKDRLKVSRKEVVVRHPVSERGLQLF